MDFLYIVVPAIVVALGALIISVSIRRILSLRKRSCRTWRRLAEGAALALLALVAAVLAGSSGFNAIALYYYRHPPPGRMYWVNGRRMRMDCMGSGSPTIVLEAGAGGDGLIWSGIQPVLAKTTRVCSYDRAGLGWSDVGPLPRDADHVATELHALLAAANIDGPIVLMGHSLGGLFIRDYATRYPPEVAGLVFVDSSTPLQDRNPAFQWLDRRPHWVDVLVKQAEFVAGIPRLLGVCSRRVRGLDARAGELLAEDQCHEQFFVSAAELMAFHRSGQETVHTGPYGALPILIFSEDPKVLASNYGPAAVSDDLIRMQEDLMKLSTRSRRIVAKGSGHGIELDRPELIEQEVALFIEQIRGTAPQPTDYESTTVE